jgi:hypothetical protein
MRIRAALIAATILAALAGCGDDGGSGAGPADSPEETLTRLVGYVVDDKAEAACALMIVAVRAQFGPENDVKDCETAVSSLSSQVTDKKAFRAMTPSGLKVDGDTAEVSGYCGKGWRKADGSRSDLPFDPNDLGTLKLRKTDDGWMISDYRGKKRYSTCGG